ncbi:MAG: MmgE/PrpD family protein [Deltaproteobacteria bacterium]|nr:MmgE/PrpD family protein [Candidatus Zymogenaceae bacterium]
MEYSKKLAEFCRDLTFDDLPKEVVHKAKLCVLDYVANVYGSLFLDAARNTAGYVKSLGGQAKVSCHGLDFKAGVEEAAFLNGTLAEAIEAQDGLRFGGNHPGTAVIPAAFACAENGGCDGRAFLEAVVAGYEAANRAAAAVHPRHTLSGFLPTGTTSTFGAAAAAGKLIGLSGDAFISAIGNAGYLLPLSMAEQLMGGYTIKIVQGGQAASAGIRAASLAGAGLTGLPGVLEGTELGGGFAKITIDQEPNLDRIIDRLGEHFTIMDIYFKPYTACRHTHGAAQAALELQEAEDISPGDIEAVEVFTYGIALIAVGKKVVLGDSFVNAQFSIPYVVSVCLFDRELGPAQLAEKRLADKTLIDFTTKVTVTYDDELNSMYPEKTASAVTLTMKDKKTLTKRVEIPKGDPRDPMEATDLAAKIHRFAGERDKKRLDRVIDMITHLETLSDIRELSEAL